MSYPQLLTPEEKLADAKKLLSLDMKSPHELWSGPVEAEALKVRLDDLH